MIKFSTLQLAAIAATLLLTSCVNEISSAYDEESETIESEGTIPITFKASVNTTSRSARTRVTENAFDADDEVGLFATITGTDITGRRYIDNLKLIAGSDQTLTPETTVYYPVDGSNVDFVAYFPYTSSGVESGESSMAVSVAADQSESEGLSTSDFMKASVSNVASSSEAVELSFSHMLSRIKVELIPADEDVSGLLAKDPVIIANGFYTAADYDFVEDSFNNLSKETSTIELNGSWEASTDRLTGKEMIVVPQTVTSGEQSFTLEINGVVYNCILSNHTLTSGTQRTVEITVTESANYSLDALVGSVEGWTEGDNQTTTSQSSTSFVQISALTYSASNVYRVYSEGYAVAEICREYLNNDDVSSRATVVYPVTEDDEADLTRGTVLELLDVDGDVCGGTVDWTDDFEFTYTSGSSATVSRIYVDTDGNISITQPESTASVTAVATTIRDNRTTDTRQYAIVKIGRAYWMREDLAATAYSDGTALEQGESIADDEPNYFTDDDVTIFYNGKAILAGELPPEGWRLPTADDWTSLETYADGIAALKTGTWEIDSMGDTLADVTNLTYLSITANGWWNSSQSAEGKYVGYWILDSDGSIPEKLPFLLGTYNTLYWTNSLASTGDYYKGLSLRCIME